MANPFPGPRPYERDDASNFFGRTAEIRELRSLIASYGVVVVVGPSGCGKSSLLRAGVMPALERADYEVLPIARLGEAARGRAGRGAATPVFEGNVVSYLAEGAVPQTPHPLLTALEQRPRRASSDGVPMPRVLVIDQFEELFTTQLQAWRERSDFVGAVLAANRGQSDLRVVLVMRAEYLSALASLLSRLPDGASARERTVMYCHVERLSQRAAGDVIASTFARRFPDFKASSADKLAKQMSREFVRQPDGKLADAEGEYVEPLYLQLICRALWEKMASGTVKPGDDSLIPDADIDKELRAFVAAEIAAVGAANKMRAGAILSWLEEHLITPAGTRGSVIRQASETAGMANAVVEGLERRHVLRAEERAAAQWYELAHDRLVSGVQQLRAEVRKKREDLTMRVAQVAILATILFSVGRAFWKMGEVPAVDMPAAENVARATAERASTYLASNPEVASAWIREALSMGDDPYVDSVAREIAERALVSRAVQKLTQTPAVAVAAAPDSIVAIGTDDGRLWVMNVLVRTAPHVDTLRSDTALVVKADAATVASSADPSADVRGVVPGWNGGIVGVGYASQAAKLAVAGRHGRVSLVTRPDWRRERDTVLPDTLQSLAVTPSAREIAVGTLRGEVVRLTAQGAGSRTRLPGAGRVTSLAYLNERDVLAVDERGNVYGWRGNGGEASLLWRPPAPEGAVTTMSLMAVASTGRDVAVTIGGKIYRLTFRAGRIVDAAPIACEQLTGVTPTAIAYSRSAASLIIATSTGRMIVWGTRSGRCDWSASGPEHPILAIAPLAAGSPVVTTGENLEVRVWSQPPTAQQVRSTVADWRRVAAIRTDAKATLPAKSEVKK